LRIVVAPGELVFVYFRRQGFEQLGAGVLIARKRVKLTRAGGAVVLVPEADAEPHIDRRAPSISLQAAIHTVAKLEGARHFVS
jgi:hypothetical protein